MKRIIFISLLCSFYALETFACSALFIKRDLMIMGKNFDWYSGEGMIIKNNRGAKKTAYGIDLKNVAQWTSKYGSVTFNQVGKEFPYGGVNEKGLSVEMLWLSSSQYEENDQPSLSELEWIQYQLDNYKTAAEVEANLNSISINPISANLHYFVTDRGGRSFVLDFINGEAVVSHTKNEYQAITNDTYQSSMKYFEKTKDSVLIDSKKSKDRFSQLMSKVSSRNAKSIGGMFRLLAESTENKKAYKTYWTIVYDLDNLQIAFRTYDNSKMKVIEMKTMDFSQYSPVLGMDVNTKEIYWKSYNKKMNLALIINSLKQAKIKLNVETANQHMMNPALALTDDTYSKYHKDLKVQFKLKKTKGYLFYTLTNGEENFKCFNGEKSGVSNVKSNIIEVNLYSLPIAEYALASYHDLDANFKLNTNIFGIPSEPSAFSNNVKGWFGSPPSYEKAMFNLKEVDQLTIDIK